jgi:hypothetical protein
MRLDGEGHAADGFRVARAATRRGATKELTPMSVATSSVGFPVIAGP